MNLDRLKSNKIFKDSIWTITGNALGKGLTVIGGIIIAKLLGKDVFGEYGLLRNTLLMIAVFSTLGLGYTSTIFVSKYRDTSPNLLYLLIRNLLNITIGFSSIIAILVFIFSEQIALLLEDTALILGLKYLSVIIVLNALTTTQIGILAGLKLFKNTAYVNILCGICNFFITISLTVIWGFNGALLALLISQLINCILNSYVLRKNVSRVDGCGEIPLKYIMVQSIPIALQEMSVSLMHWIGYYLLLKFTGYGEVGLYSAATQWSVIILFIPVTLRNVVLSHLSSKQNSVQHRKIFYSMMGLYVLSTFIPSTLIAIFSNFIVGFYGESFIGLKYVLIFGCYSTVFNSVYNIYSSEFMSLNRNWLMYIITIFRDLGIVISLILCIYIINLPGALSMSISTLLSSFVIMLVCLLVHRKIKVAELRTE